MAEPTPVPPQSLPGIAAAGHEAVIRLVLSGPAPADNAAGELAALRERVTTLERALADADARIESIAQAVAAAIAAVPVAPVSERVELLLREAARRTEPDGADPARATPEPRPASGSQPPPPVDEPAPKARGLRRMVTALKPH